MNDPFDQVRSLLRAAVGPVFPAAQLIVVDGGVTALDEAVGDCTRDTIFDLASLTKALSTTTLVMHLIERGRLGLEDELRPGVTVRLALCHASGLPAWRPFYQLLAPAGSSAGAPTNTLPADPRTVAPMNVPVPRSRADALAATAAVIDAVRAEPLERPPGSRSVYSDLGFLLLGDAVARAGDAPLDEQFASLGLCGATFHPDPARCAPTEGELRGVVHDDNCRFMGGVAGHAGLFGTASDVSAAADALVAAWHGDAHRVVAPDTVRRFWSPAGVPGSDWCLGWDRPSTLTSAGPVSSAGTRWPTGGVGHLGFTGCSLWIDPPRRRHVVLVSNRVYPSRASEAIKALRPRLHDAVVAALDDPA